jgi:ABC-2 type transport system permease protein
VIGAVYAEWLKTRSRLGFWVLAVSPSVLLALLGYLALWLVVSHPVSGVTVSGGTPAQLRREFYPENFVHASLGQVFSIGGALILLLGTLTAGGEYGWATMKTIFTQLPGRVEVWVGKVAFLAVFTGALAAVYLLTGALCSLALATVDRVSVSWPSLVAILGADLAVWLIFMTWASFGMLLAVLVRQSAVAVGIGLVYVLVVENVLAGILSGVSQLRALHDALPGVNAAALVGSLGKPTHGGPVSPEQAAFVLVAYTAAFVVISATLVRRRDVA